MESDGWMDGFMDEWDGWRVMDDGWMMKKYGWIDRWIERD